MSLPDTVPELDIVGAGCSFPSGPNLALADIALLTQRALVRKHPFYVDRCGQRARVSAFPDTTLGPSRWWALAQAALNDLNRRLGGRLRTQPAALWFLLPDAKRPGTPADLFSQLAARLYEWRPEWTALHVLRGDRALGVQALNHAGTWLEKHPEALGVLVAVDCPMASDTLFWLESHDRLHGAHHPYEGRARANPYGRIPGEGAAALAVSLPHSGHSPWARILAGAMAHENIPSGDDRPCLGAGLSQAGKHTLLLAQHRLSGKHATSAPRGLRAAWRELTRDDETKLAPVPLVGRLTADLNGEPYRADEFGFTYLHLAPWLREDCRRDTPALASGDLGSASAIAHTALAAYALRGRTAAPLHLILSSSDDPLRGALVLAPAAYPAQVPS